MLIIPRRSESILFLLGFSILGAVGNIAKASSPPSVKAVLPFWAQVAWNLALLVGSVIALVAILWRETYLSLQAEAIGLLMAGLSTLFYGVVVPFYAGWTGGTAGGIAIAFGLTMLFRRRRIEKVLATPPEAK
jgi:hypothetical protein